MESEEPMISAEMEDMRGLLYSTVSAFTKAIDERTPYNATHTKQVAGYTEGLLDFLQKKHEQGESEIYFSPQEAEQIVMAAYLHDVGKLVIPLSIMNKATRMGRSGLKEIHERYRLIEAYLTIDRLEGRLDEKEWKRLTADLKELEERIRKADKPTKLSKAEIRYFTEMGNRIYFGKDGISISWLTPRELKNLQIDRGTLNDEERKNMEYHAVATEKILKEIQFGKQYDRVTEIAGAHHEFLDGSGYPRGLRGEQIPRGARVLTIADIYDSLVARDRPYKRPMHKEKAIQTLEKMAEEGKLDKELVTLFCEYLNTKN